MNNAILLSWRTPWMRPYLLNLPPSFVLLDQRRLQFFSPLREFSSQRPRLRTFKSYMCNSFVHRQPYFQPHHCLINFRSFHESPCLFNVVGSGSKSTPHKDAIFEKEISASEIARIFGTKKISVDAGNRILRVIQKRRVAGTLDKKLPTDILQLASPHAIDRGVSWLRRNYPMDEDAAILARIEREEQRDEDRLIHFAEDRDLYKPQSGRFGASITKEKDVYGHSILEEIRSRNEKSEKQKMEDERREWLDGGGNRKLELERQIAKSGDLQKSEMSVLEEARPRADPISRPALAWIQKHHLRATPTDWDTSKLTKVRRILPSFAASLLVVGVCFLYSDIYEPPLREARLFPEIEPATATVITLIGSNIAVFALWRLFPPAWRMLNSHQQFRHLGTNMFILWFIGLRLHDEIGRGQFLATYVSAGVVASVTSLSAHVIGGNLNITSLGASGAIAGLVAMWCILHSDDKISFSFLPRKWQEKFSASGSLLLGSIILLEIISFMSPMRFVALDRWSHLGGYACGALIGWRWKNTSKKK